MPSITDKTWRCVIQIKESELNQTWDVKVSSQRVLVNGQITGGARLAHEGLEVIVLVEGHSLKVTSVSKQYQQTLWHPWWT